VALARAKREVQDIVKREWLAAGAKGKTRARLARFQGEGIQKRETIELPNVDNSSTRARVLGPSKPHMLLTDGSESLADRSADVSNAYQTSSEVDTKSPKLTLIKPDEEAALDISEKYKDSKSRRSSKRKRKLTSKSPVKKANRVVKNTSSDSAVEPHREELDMTGWTGDYNLPK
jgi:hypothetical protein